MKKIFSILSSIFFMLHAQAQIPTSGLLHRYTFDSTLANTTATHTLASGNGNYSPDRNAGANQAQYIVGANASFSNAGIPNLPTGNSSRTVAFWCRGVLTNISAYSLFNYGASTNYFGIAYTASPSEIRIEGGSGSLVRALAFPSSWTHIAVTYDGSKTTLYINGTAVSTSTAVSFATTTSPTSRMGISAFAGTFTGYEIDDLLIYDRAITGPEVRSVFSFCSPTNTTAPANLRVCAGNSTTLTASGGNISWFADSLGGVALGSGNSFTTPNISAITTYYAQSTGCASRTPIQVVTGTLSGNQTISCLQGTTTFSSTVSGGTWSSSDGAIATVNPTTGVVTGVSAGTATITYTVAGNTLCQSATDTRTVEVFTALSAGTLSGTQALCRGWSFTTFSSTVSGGTWSSSNTAIATVNSTTGQITGVAAGTATISYTVVGSAPCLSATNTRTVEVFSHTATAGTLSGTQTVCSGSTTTFSSTVTGGTWSSSNNNLAIVNASTGVVSGVSAGTAIITYVVAGVNTCPNPAVTRSVTVSQTTTSTQSKAICQGESFTFKGQALTQAGQYRDTLTNAAGCDSILTLSLTVNALPTPTISKTGANLSTQTFVSYQWKFNGNNISGATSQNYTATQNGSYTVEVTDTNGCKNTSAAVQVTGLAISDIRLSDIRFEVYPNPTNDVLNIEVEVQEFTLTVTDIAGRRMMIAENKKAISLSALASGVYNIEIKTANGIARKQFIKK